MATQRDNGIAIDYFYAELCRSLGCKQASIWLHKQQQGDDAMSRSSSSHGDFDVRKSSACSVASTLSTASDFEADKISSSKVALNMRHPVWINSSSSFRRHSTSAAILGAKCCQEDCGAHTNESTFSVPEVPAREDVSLQYVKSEAKTSGRRSLSITALTPNKLHLVSVAGGQAGLLFTDAAHMVVDDMDFND